MALKGTLKDFGVAEILQLIAQQTKSGVLRLRNRDEEVHVGFEAGNVVRAEQVAGQEVNLLGHRLVRAGIITERELEDALEEQRRTLKRLGDVLVARNAVAREDLREMAQLQATETLYRLFTWKSGTYEFEAGEVTWEKGSLRPIRGEAILMEGFRMVDEWPLIRKKISSRRMTFERLKELPDVAAPADGDGDGDDLDAAFGGAPAPSASGSNADLGASEWRVMALVQTGRTVERLVELSRLGEFETCKALFNLVSAGYLKAIAPPRDQAEEPGPGAGMVRAVAGQVMGFGLRVALTVGLLAFFTGLVYLARTDERAGGTRGIRVEDPAAQRMVGRIQMARITAALEVYRLEAGGYPEALEDLVATELLDERDLRHPWRDRYHYRRVEENAFVLLPPYQ